MSSHTSSCPHSSTVLCVWPQSLRHVWLFATLHTVPHQAPLSMRFRLLQTYSLSLYICQFWTHHIAGGLLWLASFTEHNILKVHSYCPTDQYCIRLHGQIMERYLQWSNIPFVCMCMCVYNILWIQSSVAGPISVVSTFWLLYIMLP